MAGAQAASENKKARTLRSGLLGLSDYFSEIDREAVAGLSDDEKMMLRGNVHQKPVEFCPELLGLRTPAVLDKI